jgi:hypothetical protein
VSRASGKHGPRTPTPGEDREMGIGPQRDIPGGLNHLANEPVQRQDVPVPSRPPAFHEGENAHGVPFEEHGRHDRDPRLTGTVRQAHPHYLEPEPVPLPVPVYIVERGGGGRPQSDSAHRRITIPAAGSEPAEICGADSHRIQVQLLNEDATHSIRFGKLAGLVYDPANQVVLGGTRLPAAATGYLRMRTQGPLWAVSETSNPVVISVITEYEISDSL